MYPSTRQAIAAATLAVFVFSMFAPSHAYAHGGGHGGGGGHHGGWTGSGSGHGRGYGYGYVPPAVALPRDDWPSPDDLIEARLHRFITQHLMHGFIAQHLHRPHLGPNHHI